MARAPEFRLAGIPVRVEPVFFVIVVLLGIGQPPLLLVSWVLIAAVSVLLHELGHAVAFRAYGLTPRIVLHGLGGLTTTEGVLSPVARIVTSLAGPLSALVVLGLPALWLRQAGVVSAGDASDVVAQVIWINIGWSVLNLVPVLPLDGGQVFHAGFDLVSGGRGRRAAEITSIVVAGAIAVLALRAGYLFGGVLAGALAAINVRSLSQARHDQLADRLDVAHRALLIGDVAAADAELAAVAAARPPTDVRAWGEELARWSALLAGRPVPPTDPPARAASGAAPTPDRGPSSAFRAAEALAAGRRDEGAALAAWTLAHDEVRAPKGLLAVVVARTGTAALVAEELAHLGEPGRAGGTLLRDLLAHLGHAGAAAVVDASLTRPGLA